VEMAQIVSKSRSTGVIFFGGGTAKNFIQQSEATASMLHNTPRGHKFALQVITESAEYGGYSGAEFDQAQSFGRLSKSGRAVTVRCDATIAMPILVTSLSQTASKAMRTRKRIQFAFGKDLGITMP
jgi:deoxyhypusine synthase